jgi:hypothetical protein
MTTDVLAPEPEAPDEVIMATQTAIDTKTDDSPALDAELPPGTSWLVFLRPDDDPAIIPMPPHGASPEQEAEFRDRLMRSIPRGVLPTGCIAMPRSDGGFLNLQLFGGFSPSRVQLARLWPFVLSRWSARIFSFGEIRFEPDFHVFGVAAEPAIVRTSADVGPALAASCTGRPIRYLIRDDGLRAGIHPTHADMPDAGTLVGFIENAECDAEGIVASLLLLRHDVHEDLEALDAAGQLEAARLCLSHSATATPRRTAWGLKVFDVTSASANALEFTSLSHSPATHMLRRLALDEPLGTDDFRQIERLHVPRELGATVTEPAQDVTAPITPGAVTPTKRSPLLTLQQTISVPTGGPNAITFTHNLGLIPHVTVDAGHDNIFTSINSVTTTQARVSAYNFGPTVTRTITAYCW